MCVSSVLGNVLIGTWVQPQSRQCQPCKHTPGIPPRLARPPTCAYAQPRGVSAQPGTTQQSAEMNGSAAKSVDRTHHARCWPGSSPVLFQCRLTPRQNPSIPATPKCPPLHYLRASAGGILNAPLAPFSVTISEPAGIGFLFSGQYRSPTASSYLVSRLWLIMRGVVSTCHRMPSLRDWDTTAAAGAAAGACWVRALRLLQDSALV